MNIGKILIDFLKDNELWYDSILERPANKITAWFVFADNCYKHLGVSSRSVRDWSSYFGWTIEQTEYFFGKLESDGLITIKRMDGYEDVIELYYYGLTEDNSRKSTVPIDSNSDETPF